MRCSKCGGVWHQKPEASDSAEIANRRTKSEHLQDAASPQPNRPGHSPEVLRVLREEAEREVRFRREEATVTTPAPSSGGKSTEVNSEALTQAPDKGGTGTSQRGDSDEGKAHPKTTRSGGILIPGLVILTALTAVLVYSYAPQIAQMIPQAELQLVAYVNGANELRTLIKGLIEAMVNVLSQAPESAS